MNRYPFHFTVKLPRVVLAVTAGGSMLAAELHPRLFFGDWPAGTSPAEVGKRVAENFVVRKLDYEITQSASTHLIPKSRMLAR